LDFTRNPVRTSGCDAIIKLSLILILIFCTSTLSVSCSGKHRLDASQVKSQINSGGNIEETDSKTGYTLLHRAVYSNDPDLVAFLIAKGAKIDALDKCGYTPLSFAAMNKNKDIAGVLIEAGANLNHRDCEGYTPLLWAIYNDSYDMTIMLIRKGADINLPDSGGLTPLMVACSYKRYDIAKMLIDEGVDLSVKDSSGFKASDQLKVNQKKATKIESSLYDLIKEKEAAQIENRNALMAQLKEQQEQSHSGSNLSIPQTQNKPGVFKAPPYIPKSSSESTFEDIREIPDFNTLPNNNVAVVIGIEKYLNVPPSDYSESDAGLVKDYLKALGFQERNIEYLTNEKASYTAIKKIIETWLPNRIKNDSKVFVYYSGHGAPDVASGYSYILPYDGDPNYLPDTAYPLNRLYEKLTKLNASEICVLLDACFSGAGGRSVIAKGARPLIINKGEDFTSANLAIMTATQNSQISISSPEKGHGIFTFYFLKAIKDGKKDVADIYSYIRPLVEEEAKHLNVQQSPNLNLDPEKLAGRFKLRD